jgi:hypothetical protein
MSYSYLKKLWNETGVCVIIILLLIAYGVGIFGNYISSKSYSGSEYMTGNKNPAYSNNNKKNSSQGSSSNYGVKPSEPIGQNEVFSSVSGIGTPSQGSPTSCTNMNIQNPADLLPKDTNSQWAHLNPTGQGELANINLLRAGYHIGIDSIGSTLRNANLQIRSEPPNPQVSVGPWNLSTIEPDFMRSPLEIGQGQQ